MSGQAFLQLRDPVGAQLTPRYIFTTLLPLCAAKIHAPWERRPLVDFFRQLCLSVDALHQLGISHEDLKRSNILVSSNFRPAIIDLGFGHFNPYGDFVASNGGTLDYTSPEKAAVSLLCDP